MSDLVNSDRAQFLESIRTQCNEKQEGLEAAKEMFAEDL